MATNKISVDDNARIPMDLLKPARRRQVYKDLRELQAIPIVLWEERGIMLLRAEDQLYALRSPDDLWVTFSPGKGDELVIRGLFSQERVDQVAQSLKASAEGKISDQRNPQSDDCHTGERGQRLLFAKNKAHLFTATR